MAAPTHSSRPAPAGIQMPNGFSSVITFARLTTASFWTQKSKPGAIDGGEPILQSTMHNTAVHTKAPRALRMEEDIVVTAAYDPNLRSQIRSSLLNAPGSITEYLSDGSYEDFYGYLQKADFADLQEGELPLVTLTIVKTNWDPVNRVEVAPVFSSVSGT